MFKLNFEKSVIFVLILIFCISTIGIFSQFLSTFFNRRAPNEVHHNVTNNISFPADLLKGDRLYKKEAYKDAQGEYQKLTIMPNLSPQQKAAVYFKLGICDYRLKEYDLARDSFIKSTEFNINDPVAYNNAAVCSFYLDDLERAEELQKLAIANLPVIEYHYNLARIYEASGRYMDSAKYYTAVVRGEENITRDDRIDPVRIKNKVMRLLTDLRNAEEISKDLMMALRLKDAREVFIIDDVNMDIKGKNFKWSIVKENGISKLHCSYDRKKSDPYNLIDSLQWTVEKNGKSVYTGKKDAFSLSLIEGNNYSVYLDINYNTNKHARSDVDVMRSNGMYSSSAKPTIPTIDLKNAKCKYYEYAVYEQVFDKNFRISRYGYIDRFNTEWGKDDVEAVVMDKDFRDTQSAIYIKNTSDKAAGIWADLSSLIKDKNLRGKTIGIRFYARKITPDGDLSVNIRVKSEKEIKRIPRKYELLDNYKWKQFGVDVLIPDNTDGLTISFETSAGEEFKIDGFIITIVR